MFANAPKGESRLPWALLLGGILLAGLSVASGYVFPYTRFSGVNPVSVAQVTAFLAGCVGISVGEAALRQGGFREAQPGLRNLVQFAIVDAALQGLLSWSKAPHAMLLAWMLTLLILRPLRRFWRWLGAA